MHSCGAPGNHGPPAATRLRPESNQVDPPVEWMAPHNRIGESKMAVERNTDVDQIASAQDLAFLAQWNDSSSPLTTCTVPELFAAAAQQNRSATALVAGHRSWSYTELSEYVNQLAHHLLDRGVGSEDVVAVCLPRSAEMVVAVLAIMVAGGAFVPVDPAWPEQRRREVINDAGAVLMVTDGDTADRPVPAVEIELASWAFGAEPGDAPQLMIEPPQLAYVIFTSGSTGKPKGAMIRHEAICARLRWQVEEILLFGPGDASLFKAPLSFDISVNEILLPLVSGGYVVVAEPGGERDPQYLLELIADQRVTFVYLVSSMLDVLLEMSRGTAKLSGLKHVWCGGEVLTPELFERFRKQLSTTLYHGYGPAEATIGVSHVIYRDDAERIATSIGRPNPNTQLYVLDEHLNALPVGMGGELYAAGFLLSRGYINAPGMTGSRFIANPFDENGSRLYRTGDLARWNVDGSLEFLGRADNQVKIRGMRLELEEVEAALAAHPDVRQAAVLTRDNRNGAKYLAGYALTDTGADVASLAEDLRTWCAGRLPEYMVPSTYMLLESFPMTPNGKVDRRALPEPVEVRTDSRSRDPRTPTERLLCEIFAEVLGVDAVGAEDDFFALGGDSIVAIGVVSRARRAGVRLRPREMFELRTPAALAIVAREITTSLVPAVSGVGAVPATPIIEWLWETGPSAGFYQSMALQSPVEMTTDRLESLVSALIGHHDILRARFETDAAGRPAIEVPVFVDGPVASLISSVAVGDCDEDALADHVLHETEAAALRLDPESGRVAEFVWLDRGRTRRGLLLMVLHHLVVDGVSLRILADDLQDLWRGDTPAPVPTSFREWSLILSTAACTGTFDDDLGYWRTSAECPDPMLGARPLDPVRDTVATEQVLTVDIPTHITEPLLRAVPSAIHGGVNDALLAALAAAVAEWRAQDADAATQVLLELEGHGREAEMIGAGADHVDLSRTVGWFTTLYPVPLDPGVFRWEEITAGGKALARIVKSVKEQLRAVPRSGLSYGALRHLCGGAYSELAVAPQLLFNYLGRFPAGAARDWATAHNAGVVGEDRDPRMPLPRVLEINAMTVDTADGPVLTARISWPAAVLEAQDVQALADLWLELLGVIATDASIAGFTPSDFPLVALEDADIAELEEAVPGMHDVLPLLPLQLGMYFHASYGDDSADTYRIQQIAELTGPLDAGALHRAVAEMIARHPALRAGFRGLADGRVVQVIANDVEFEWKVVDLAALTITGAQERLTEISAADRARPFDLATPPLLRYTIVSLSPDQHRLVQTMHHIIADGWSYPLMFNDIVDAYRGTLAGPSTLSLGNHIAALASVDERDTHAVWSQVLSGIDEPTLLVDAEPGERISEHRVISTSLSPEQSAALVVTSRDHGVTLSTTLHAVWGVLLGRLLGRDSVVFGSTVSGRGGELAGVESIVGLLINTIPVPMSVPRSASLREVAIGLQARQTAVLEHHHVGLGELAQMAGQRTLFDTLVIVENFPEVYAPQDDSGLSVHGFTSTTSSHYPLSLVAFPGQQIRLEVKYDVGLVEESDARRLLVQVCAIVEQLLGDPDVTVGRLQLLAADDRRKVLQGFNTTEHAIGERTLPQLFESWARRTPDVTAVVFEGQKLSYSELNARANMFARILVANGVTPASLVAVKLPRSIELIVALYAVHKAGAAYLPVDPDYPDERIAFMLDDAQPTFVVDDPAMVTSTGDGCDLGIEVTTTHPAYVIYTSGSTGRPKGVMVPHAGVVNFLSWMQGTYQLESGEMTLQKTPSSFDASIRELFWPLISGATMVLAKPDGHKDAAYLADLIREHGVTTAQFVPSMLSVFLEEPSVAECVSLRRIIAGGEALPNDVVARFDLDAQLHNVYGPTEASIDVTAWHVTGSVAPIGRPVWNTQLYVLDSAMQPVAPGTAGELYIAGVQLAHGYLGRAGLTSERFVANPFASGRRMYRSGDLARWTEDGILECLGRIDQQVQVRGFRIEPGEIEAALTATAEVTRAVVVVRDRRLVAYVVGVDADPIRLKASVSMTLPEHMVPAIIVPLAEMPLTPNGKLDRNALPNPDFESLVSGRGPRNASESLLCRLFAEVLGMGRIGIDDDFFHSRRRQHRVDRGVRTSSPGWDEDQSARHLPETLRRTARRRPRPA
ncbi:MAG: amino acid adenylation domain-containing protein [Rhodococcus sp. (in: high G+C Gram-positive bacteria)]|nr:amino acid adenylation domain-containing protein [Rhodococcus sp. (in: high G+C Gram-positive bacteria)]